MKKLVLLVLLLCVCLALPVSAAPNNCVKFAFSAVPPEGSGWIGVNDYTGKLEAGDTLSVTVYNGGPEEFYCFLSTRESKEWLTVGKSDFVYISPGTSEVVEIPGITADAAWYLLELRELTADAVVYIQGSEEVDYTAKLAPMSELVEGKYCRVEAAEFPKEGEVLVPQPTEEDTVPTAAPTASPTPEITESPAVPTASTVPSIGQQGASPWIVPAVCAAAVVIIAGVVLVAVKNKKKNGEK